MSGDEQVIRIEERIKVIENQCAVINEEVKKMSNIISQMGERIAKLEARVCLNYNGYKMSFGMLKDLILIILMAIIGIRGIL